MASRERRIKDERQEGKGDSAGVGKGCYIFSSRIGRPEGKEWICEYLSDYKLNLVHAGNVKPENFKTGLKQVFELLPFSADAEKLQAYMEEHKEEFRNVTEETCELLLTFFDDRDMKLLEEREVS